MSEKRTTRLTVGILSVVCLTNAATSFSPALASIQAAFPGTDNSTLQMIVTIASLASLLGSLIAGKLQDVLAQKRVIQLGLVFLSLGALPLLIHHSFYVLYALASLMAFGAGLLTATGPAYISRHFEGDDRSRVMGLKTSLQGLGSMALSSIAGVLALTAWYYAFAIYLAAIASLIVASILLPEEPRLAEGKKEASAGGKKEAAHEEGGARLTSPTTIALLLLAASITCMQACVSNNLSLHCATQEIGGSDIAGFGYSLLSAGLIVGGVLYPYLFPVTKAKTLSCGYLFGVIGMLLIGFSSSAPLMFAGNVCVGIMYGICMTRVPLLISRSVRPSLVPKAMSAFAGLAALGFAFSSTIFNTIGSLFAGPLETMVFFVAAGLAAVLAIVLLVLPFEKKLDSQAA